LEELLIEFINILDLALKKQMKMGAGSGISKLTISQFQYIDAIYQLGEPRISEIADKLQITKASVTTTIHRLNDLGYVLKTQSSEDKRVFQVK
jgi:DNA-binding MarR family transcriptional regulator